MRCLVDRCRKCDTDNSGLASTATESFGCAILKRQAGSKKAAWPREKSGCGVLAG